MAGRPFLHHRSTRSPGKGVDLNAENVGRQTRRLRILLADDHQLILDGIRNALQQAGDDFEIVGEATKGSHVLPLVKRTQPDVVMLDLRMPEVDGLVCLDQIKKHHPATTVIVLSVSADRNLIDNVLKRGASAYIVKSVNPVDLPAVIRQAVEGTVYTAIGLPDDLSSRAAKAAGLSERELAILTALAHGLSNAAIAKQLWVAPQTVKFHLTNIYRKLGVTNRTEAARYAYQQGLIESPLHDGDESSLA
jgi:DNA-binding NarL/FixJ family response regulator